MKIIIKLIKFVWNEFVILVNRINSNLNKNKTLQLLSLTFNQSGRFLIFHFINNELRDYEDVLRLIFNSLRSNEDFTKFGNNKVIIVSCIVNGQEYSFHHNVLINNDTTFEEYYNEVVKYIDNHYDTDNFYGIEVIPEFKVKVWNMDNYLNKDIKLTKKANNIEIFNKPFKRSYSTINYNNFITPIPNIPTINENISTMDIETMEIKGKQIPIVISLAYVNSGNEIESKIFIIDHNLEIDKAVNNLWLEVLNFIIKNNGYFKFIFVHNLGSFDGWFIHKALSIFVDIEQVKTIMDNQNKFISIHYKEYDIKWLDSYRIFPVSLNDLCKTFNVSGKTNEYKEIYNSMTLFGNDKLLNEFINYSLQDSISLLEALLSAQHIYMKDFNIDICSIVSTSSLSLKIFRTKFLNVDIPILKGSEDFFVRKSYFGGATDYYKAHGENLKHLDINSLYPFAMCKPIPHQIIKKHNNLNIELTLDTQLFGFFEAYCETPETLKPMLPYKEYQNTIYPVGKWKGIYFSEEMKALLKYGYKFTLIKGYEFSKVDLFTEYVNHFFDIKKNSTGSTKFIAKMHLNQLYGIFGRRQDLIETVNIYNKDLDKYLLSKVIKSVITINHEKSTLLIRSNLDVNILKKLNSYFETDFTNSIYNVKSNVAIASAVTSYARIHMLEFKMKYDIWYTDTDSIFTDSIIDLADLGNELGLFKDELNGNIIKEAYFLGIKQYGYSYKDKDNNIIEKSTFAGVPKNTITFSEIRDIHNGKAIFKNIKPKFFKSLKDLSITIKKDIKLELKRTNKKVLKDNIYLPPRINNVNDNNYNIFKSIKNQIIKLLKYLNIKI